MPHMLGAAGAAVFIYLWCSLQEKPTPLRWALLGLCGGLTTLLRWQNAALFLLPGLTWVGGIYGCLRRRQWSGAAALTWAATLLTGAALLVFLPQILAWRVIYGEYVLTPPGGPVRFPHWTSPWLWQVLFSAERGLFTWAPLLLLASYGLVFLGARYRGTALAQACELTVQIYINAAVVDFWAGWSFGARRFTDILPIFSLGLASLLDRLQKWRRPALLAFAAFPAWNFLFMLQFLVFNPTGTSFFSFHEMTWGKVEVIVSIMRRLGMGF